MAGAVDEPFSLISRKHQPRMLKSQKKKKK